MLELNVIIALAIAVVGLVVVFLGAAQLLATRWGRRALLHNFDYAAQLLFDSIEASGGSVAALKRP